MPMALEQVLPVQPAEQLVPVQPGFAGQPEQQPVQQHLQR
jgi:hypothetical protein